jgi:hypothetical protein
LWCGENSAATPSRIAAALDGWMDRHREDTKQRSEHRDFHLIYVNGPVYAAAAHGRDSHSVAHRADV